MTSTILNTTLNQIHDWGEPEQHPMKRMFLTRVAGLGCAAIEAGVIALTTGHLIRLTASEAVTGSAKALRLLFPKSETLSKCADRPTHATQMKSALVELCHLVAGLASTIFNGIIFSPAINFRMHIKWGLAIDNLAVKKQKNLDAKLKAQAAAEAITQARAERFAQFEANRQAVKTAQAEEDAIDAHLAELLCPAKN